MKNGAHSLKTPVDASASYLSINLSGIVCYIGFLVIALTVFPQLSTSELAVYAILATIIPIVVLETVLVKPYKRLGLQRRIPDKKTVRTKVSGLYGTLLVICICYLLFPEYEKMLYRPYLPFITNLGLIIFCFGFIYIDIAERWLPDCRDGLWHMGCLLERRWAEVDKTILAEHCRSWLIKAYFLPIMFSCLVALMEQVQTRKLTFYSFYVAKENNQYNTLFLNHLPWSQWGVNDWLLVVLFLVITIDVLCATIGYLMTFKCLDANIKSSEPTLVGWFVCLMCYAPFWDCVFYPLYLGYQGKYDWRVWYADSPALLVFWTSLVLLTQAANSFSTVTMGIRFSNLTYRGLVTSGLYRFTKHPQYIAKWLNWFLVSMPFVSVNGWFSALRAMLMLLAVGGIYYMRARTEENHLSNYPEYVNYANWINEHGVLRSVVKIFPYFKYSEQRAKASGSIVWQKRVGQKPYV